MRAFHWGAVVLVALLGCSVERPGGPAAGAGESSGTRPLCEADETTLFGESALFRCELCGVHGHCQGAGRCVCFGGFAGPRCDTCQAGFIERNGNCVTPCAAAGVPCTGICTGTESNPVCTCRRGYEGPRCEQCAEGFALDKRAHDGIQCRPTCGGTCPEDEVCVASADGDQRCECMLSYERGEGGACEWIEPLADPQFERGCESWTLQKVIVNTGHDADAVIDESGLHLHVTHRCSGASASAEASLPAAQSLPGAALAITAKGAAGSALSVDLGGGPAPFFTSHPQMSVTGTGEWTRHVVCLPLREHGQKTPLRLSVGSGGACGELATSRFTVSLLEIVSDPACQ